MTQDIDYQIEVKARQVAEQLIHLREKEPTRYYEMRAQLRRELGEEFYNKHIAWHEDK